MDKLRTKVQNADWWEITYLIIYGAIFTYEFLGTTMFEIKWPPRFGYIFLAASALYTIAKFIWHNTYTKKEMILSAVILFAFLMPALLTEYRFLWWVGFLIVGAKDVDFDKILKVYLTIGITIMLAAFVASQMGWIENLKYVIERDGVLLVRNSYGSIYPTDFAAHVFYLSIAGITLAENRITFGKIINFVILAIILQDKCGARTSFLCLIMIAIALIMVKLLKDKVHKYVYYLVNMSTIACCTIYLVLTHMYDATKEWMLKLNDLLSNRLQITKEAVQLYDYKIFGQNIVEVGSGKTVDHQEGYFFLDDSYIRIALLYGVILLVVAMLLFWLSGLKAIQCKRIIILVAIAVIGVHSFMEHHILEIAYNPLLCFLLAKNSCINDKEKVRRTDVS